MKYNAADAQVSCSSYCTDVSARVIFSDLLYQQCAICRIKPQIMRWNCDFIFGPNQTLDSGNRAQCFVSTP